jgi:hypothetical protein
MESWLAGTLLDTLIGEIGQIIAAGTFDDAKRTVREGETELGELTPYEKAVFTLWAQNISRCSQAQDSVNVNQETPRLSN